MLKVEYVNNDVQIYNIGTSFSLTCCHKNTAVLVICSIDFK